MAKPNTYADDTPAVDAFLDRLDHPLKDEIQAVRAIIKAAHPGIKEQVKWNAPSFSYGENYLVTFNLRDRNKIHLVFHNPHISKVENDLLEGDYPDRRMVYLANRDDIERKQDGLKDAVRKLITLSEMRDDATLR